MGFAKEYLDEVKQISVLNRIARSPKTPDWACSKAPTPISVPNISTFHCDKFCRVAAMQQAIVNGSSPVLQAADHIRNVFFAVGECDSVTHCVR